MNISIYLKKIIISLCLILITLNTHSAICNSGLSLNVPVTETKRIILNKDISFAQQVTQANSIYVIQDKFDLHDPQCKTPITLPHNCTLIFDGGYLDNGSIIGSNTIVQAGLYHIWGSNLKLTGSWKTSDAYPEWFGAKGDGDSDDTNAISRCLDSFKELCLISTYKVTRTISIDNNSFIYGRSGKKTIQYDGNSTKPVFELTSASFILKDFNIEVSNSNFTGTCIYIHREHNQYNIINHSNRPVIRGVSIAKPHVIDEYDSKGIVIADINKKGQYNISITDCNIRGFATSLHLNAINGYINSNTIERCFFWAAKTALKISNSGSGSMVCDNKILSCSFQNASGIYKKKYKAIDVDNNVINIYENVIDIFLWDIASPLSNKGSQHGSIGKLNHNVYNSFGVFCENDKSGVLIASIDAGSKVLGRSNTKIEVQSDELSTVFNISSNQDKIWVNEAVSYTKKNVPVTWGGYHKLYYIKVDDTIYLYLVAQSGFHQVTLPTVGILPIRFGGGEAPLRELTPLSTPMKVDGTKKP